jgi:hypothetical protein
MAWTSGVPNVAQRISATTTQIEGNFAEILTDFARNHVSLNSGVVADRGKHNWSTYKRQAAAPGIAAQEINLYNKAPAAPFPVTGLSELFLQRQGATPFPISIKSFVAAGDSFFYLPCGLLVKMGVAAAVAGNATVNLDAIGQPYNAVPFVFLTPIEVGVDYRMSILHSTTSSQFVAHMVNFVGGAANGNMNWVSIGTF